MSEPSAAVRAAGPAAAHGANRAVYAAAAWALVFAAMSFYWAAGGSLGSSTMSDTIVEPARAREPQFVALLWITGALKTAAGLMALGLLATPESMHSDAARWHLVLWDPWWVLGGVLFVIAAWTCGRAPRRQLA